MLYNSYNNLHKSHTTKMFSRLDVSRINASNDLPASLQKRVFFFLLHILRHRGTAQHSSSASPGPQAFRPWLSTIH